jgi:hypothetical protein
MIGAFSGALMFAALHLVTAQTVLTIQDFHRSSRSYVGTQVQITGLAYGVHQSIKRVNGVDVPYISLNLHEIDNKGRKGKYYVYVYLPASEMKTTINEGDRAAIAGTIQWPPMVGEISE